MASIDPAALQSGGVTIFHGNCMDVLGADENGYPFELGYGTRHLIPDCSVDAVVTDPPYGLANTDPAHVAETITRWVNGERDYLPGGAGFMGKAWDAFVPPVAVWDDCLRVLKPGGHVLAFAGSRTVDLMTLAMRLAGFEIRDSIAWLYGSGFPKSLNLLDESGERTGWGTALKPAFEPVVVGRKPLAGTVAANVLAHGTGALNIDGCRVDATDKAKFPAGIVSATEGVYGAGAGRYADRPRTEDRSPAGRWPANVVLDGPMADVLDEQSGASQSRVGKPRGAASGDGWGMTATGAEYDDQGGASRFFYVAKADASERPRVDGTAHPTVKPLALMRWLVRLVTPPGGKVLEPFAGSGTTVEACLLEGFDCIAIEREADYLPLIEARISRRRDPVRAIELAAEDLGLFEFGEPA